MLHEALRNQFWEKYKMRSILEKALVHLLNEEHEKAETLFHQYMVERARQIHEALRQGDDSVLDENWEDSISEDYFTEDDLTGAEDDLEGAEDDMMGAEDAADDLESDLGADDFDSAEDDLGDMGADFADADADLEDADADIDDADADFDDAGEGDGEVDERIADLEDQL